ncbi:MAG: RNA polymerase-binding transcription factor DksA [Alphaproteobacteria bacterium MarineAlpha10_Bin3]|jgi:RNA polymerase-binding transcription factor DksA|nr:MAG: RNA polymerase-binding transcription factor DksA [Alphaproteobacteria bacterium MarineAlpha10_Bin3]PPR67411.1 MAG: RNA polymerase-binding transcription factor DksA [Alphaproteobacteria bacterium MarineAlpha4_Bin1]
MVDLQKITADFEDRLKVLSAKVDEIEEDLREPSDPDFAEHATEAEGDEVLEGLEGTALLEIAQIKAALGRIEDGVYGECATCGEPVGEKRLAVIPHAAQCISCASK